MPVETAQYIDQLNAAYPAGGEPRSQGDDHIRQIKAALKRTFPNVRGAVTRSHAELSKAPHDRASLVQLMGEKIVTSEMFQGVTAAQEIALGYDSVDRRVKARIGTNTFLPAFAFLDDVRNVTMPNENTVNFGNGIILQRLTYSLLSNVDLVPRTFPQSFARTPFMILPVTYLGNDGPPLTLGTENWSVGGEVTVVDRSRTGCSVRVRSSLVGWTKFSLYVLGQLA